LRQATAAADFRQSNADLRIDVFTHNSNPTFAVTRYLPLPTPSRVLECPPRPLKARAREAALILMYREIAPSRAI
jgi:hypothetical protein